MDEPSEETEKWFWMMQFCKDVGVSPADSYWWGKAEREYYEHLKKSAAKDNNYELDQTGKQNAEPRRA